MLECGRESSWLKIDADGKENKSNGRLLKNKIIFDIDRLTTWPSGLRRVTRNHFSSGGVGSNPAVVVFLY